MLPELVKVEHREITRGDEIAGQEMQCRSTLKSGKRGKCQKIVKMISDFQ